MECGEWDLACIAMPADVAPAAESEMGDEARLRRGWSQLMKWHWTSHPRRVNASVEFTTRTTTSTRISLTADTFSLLLSAPFASRNAGGKVLLLFWLFFKILTHDITTQAGSNGAIGVLLGRDFCVFFCFLLFARLRRCVWME